jgi:predicted permease
MKRTLWRDLSACLGGSRLDLRLALRMLAKYPLLTIVGCASMAFGIAVGVGGFEIRTQFINPVLPLEDGRKVVGLRNWDIRSNGPRPVTEADFAIWRDELTMFDDLGAFASVEGNLIVDSDIEPVSIAEMTASGFRIARVPPLVGRMLVETDELPNAQPVAVLGYSLWQQRFLADPAVVGRTVRLGSEQRTIVGVMPQAFRFPVAHELWTPLSSDTLSNTAGARSLQVFGRLAQEASIDQAQAELTTIGARTAGDTPETDAFLRPEVVPYANLFLDPRGSQTALALANIFLIMLVLLISANVALLIFARTSARVSEIAIRSALGATRGRIISQLFVEAAALSLISAIVGLAASRFVLGSFWRMVEADSGGALAFWLGSDLAPTTVVYGVALTLVGTVVVGVLPALAATGQGLHTRLQRFKAAGGGYRFGGVWTGVIVAQVAFTVMFPAAAFFFHSWVVDGQTRDVGFSADGYLSARLVMDRPNTAAGVDETANIERTVEGLRRRLTGEPGITGVTFADPLPGMQHPGGRFEIEGDDAPPPFGYEARIASIDTEFFNALGTPVLSGRGFAPSDLETGRDVAIANASFVEHILGGRDPVGRRLRRAAPDGELAPGPWTEIIGSVPDLGVLGTDGIGLYLPLAPDNSSVHVAVRVAGSPEALGNRLRTLASEVDPTLRVYDLMPLNQVGSDLWTESQYMSRALAVVSGLALLLSLIGIYSVMSFTVVQRTREIGVRAALGADHGRIIVAITRRPLVQIGLGIGAGGILVLLTFFGLFESTPTPGEAAAIAAYSVLMLGVCLLACVIPIRRALGLEASQVLQADS